MVAPRLSVRSDSRTAVRAGTGGRRDLTRTPSVYFYPAVAAYAVVVLYPSAAGVWYSFTNWNGRGTADFIGLANYARIIEQPGAIAAIGNTLLLTAVLVVGQTVIGLGLALALNTSIKSRNWLRVIFFLPVILPSVVVSVLWLYMYAPGGPIDSILELIGLGDAAPSWLGDPSIALWSIAASMIWAGVGMPMVVFLAGLQRISPELYEAARIDGAGPIRSFWSITRPLLAPAMTIVLALTLVGGLKTFDQVYIMTGGGPGYSTQTLSLLVFQEGIVLGHQGYATALAVVLTIVVATVAFVQVSLSRRLEVES